MSEPQSAPSQSYPTQPKPLSRGKYVTAIIVLSILLVGASGVTAYLYYNPRTVIVTVDRTPDLNSQIASLNSQISSDRATIDNLNTQITSLNQRISQLQSQPTCYPDSGFGSCRIEISSLQSQVNQLQSDKVTLQAKVDSLTAQVNNLKDIVNLKKSQVLASSVTVNWASCGETGQPSCTSRSRYIYPDGFSSICASMCTEGYAGYVEVTWTSTQPVKVFFIITAGSGTSTTISNSGSSGDASVPYPGTGSFLGGFQNDACFYDSFNNLHCPGGTITYSETYVY